MGSQEFLYAAGFRPTKVENNGVEEDFLLWSSENIEGPETLQVGNIYF